MARPNVKQDARRTRRDLASRISSAMLADFKRHGISAIREVREKDPGQYLRVAVQLLPKDIDVSVTHSFSDLLKDAARMIDGEVIHAAQDATSTRALQHQDDHTVAQVIESTGEHVVLDEPGGED